MTTDPRHAEAARLRETGMSWERLGKHFQCSPSTVKCWVDPEHAERRKLRKRVNAAKGRPPSNRTTGQVVRDDNIDRADVAARLAAIPEDTRSRAEKLLGDPPPGRSALDQRGQR